MPRVLVSDKLSPTAVQIFKDRGVEVDYLPDLGKDKDQLAAVIDRYDGLAIRSATKVTEKLINAATRLKVIGRAGIGVDNVDIPAASRRGIIVIEHAIRQFDHHRRACDCVDVRAGAANPRSQCIDAWRQVGEEPFYGRRDHRQDARRDRLRPMSAQSSPTRGVGLKMHVIAYDPFLSEQRHPNSGWTRSISTSFFARAEIITLHTASDRQDPQYHRCNGDRQDEGWRAHHQLRARRAGGRGRSDRRAEERQGRGRRHRRVRGRAGHRQCAIRHGKCGLHPHLGASTTEAQENVALQIAEQMADYLVKGAVIQRRSTCRRSPRRKRRA